MNSPTPYLNFQGTCEEAFTFYTKTFNGEIGYLGRFKEMPPEYKVPSNYGDKVMHVTLLVEGKPFIQGSDAPEGYGPPFNAGNNVHLTLNPDSEAEAERLYNALRTGGEVMMELTPTFWARQFAMLRDRFGINWMISYGQPG